MMLAACNILSIFSCSVWLVMKTLENMILKNHKTTLMRFLAFSIIYFHFLAILFGAMLRSLIDFDWLNLPIKQNFTKNIVAKFHVAVAPELRPSKSTKCGGLLSCEFPIFWKTIWLHQLFIGQKGPHLKFFLKNPKCGFLYYTLSWLLTCVFNNSRYLPKSIWKDFSFKYHCL